MRRIIYFFFFFLIKTIYINSLGLKNQEIWTKEILEGCKFQGEESINVNINCTNQYKPDLWDKEIVNRCIEEYNKGCQLAQINKFCELGAKNNLENNETVCKIPNQPREFGIEYYKVCCEVCNKGKEAFSRKEICERILPAGSTIVDEITKRQFENCCNEYLERNLRKLEDFDDNLGEELTACSKMNCEHFCDDLDFEKGICRCRSNYRLNENGKTCDDIDECLYENMCNKYQKCVNLPGTYECKDLILNETISGNDTSVSQKRSLLKNENEPENLEFTIDCKNGYYDPHINSCVESIDKYDKFCENEKCESSNLELVKNIEEEDNCSKGYQKNEHKKCEDVDECSSDNICQKNQLCINKIGSFLCIEADQSFDCDPGLVKKDNKCVDINECENSDTCEKDQKCINMIGQHFCLGESKQVEEKKLQNRDIKTCDKGYKLDNENCVDINECETEICSKNETCTNLPGSYKCDCKEGFEKDEEKKLCIDIDECLDEFTCSSSRSTCKNLIGSFECICKDGFEKKGGMCVDIDECAKKTHNCEQLCSNKVGNFECYCNEEYELQKDNRTCLLKDLCNEPNFCDGECVRENDEFICRKCPNGYELNKEKKYCISSDHCKPGICPTDETCINLLDRSVCVDLNCPKNYKKNNDNICVKNEEIKDETPLSITKRIIILPLSFVESIGKKTIMKFDKINEDEINFNFDVRKSDISATKNNFNLYKKNNDFYLEIIKPIENKQSFIIDVNASFKGKMLHISELKIFIV